MDSISSVFILLLFKLLLLLYSGLYFVLVSELRPVHGQRNDDAEKAYEFF